ncbi:hypothetical protein C0Q70_14299 [Pomacea canaliculata]|uniref:SSD domain-containing protein n=1 Tax=Pomacea canaliculata TaxID=400727 RepID=A0A2T7NZL7_POMCA|nr:hypothetical protein C0Q70_14299 [Pomacea canaliculata]
MTYQASLSEIPGSKIEETEQSDRGNLDTGGQEEDVRSPLRVCRLVASYPHITFWLRQVKCLLALPQIPRLPEIEDRVYNISGFTNFCQLTWARTCVKPTSVLRFFDGTYSNIDHDSLDSNFDNISDVLHAAYSRPESRPTLLYALEKNYKLNSTSLQASMTRSKIPFGLPTKGADSYESARDLLVSFMSEHVQPVLDEFRGDERLELLYYNPYLMIHEARNQAFQDMKLAGGSLAFIFLYVLLHTRSLWVTCLAVFSIACSFLETNLVYRVVLNYQYFGFFHIIAIFVILGIGVDDLFVFWDSWLAASRTSLSHPCPPSQRGLPELGHLHVGDVTDYHAGFCSERSVPAAGDEFIWSFRGSAGGRGLYICNNLLPNSSRVLPSSFRTHDSSFRRLLYPPKKRI